MAGNTEVLTYLEAPSSENPYMIEIYHAFWKLEINNPPKDHPDYNEKFVTGELTIYDPHASDKANRRVVAGFPLRLRRHSLMSFANLLIKCGEGTNLRREIANLRLYMKLPNGFKRLIDVQTGNGGAYSEALFRAIELANEEELEKLKQVYPMEVRAWQMRRSKKWSRLIKETLIKTL